MMNFVHLRVAMLRYFHLRYLGHDLLNFRRKLVYPVNEKVYHDNLGKTDGHKVAQVDKLRDHVTERPFDEIPKLGTIILKDNSTYTMVEIVL